jgi:hypothetical protein
VCFIANTLQKTLPASARGNGKWEDEIPERVAFARLARKCKHQPVS